MSKIMTAKEYINTYSADMCSRSEAMEDYANYLRTMKTCIACKFYLPTKNEFQQWTCSKYRVHTEKYKSFGCNKFEEKESENG